MHSGALPGERAPSKSANGQHSWRPKRKRTSDAQMVLRLARTLVRTMS